VNTSAAQFNLAQSLNEAMALQRQGRLREAEKIYTRVLKAAPDHFDALNMLGIVKAQLGRMGEAHRLLSAAVRINPREPGAWANLGQVLHALKRNQEAAECLDKARALAPDDVGILNQHANALLSLGRREEALEEFRLVLARVPQHAEARVNSGIAHAALGSPEQAVAEFDSALLIAPGHLPAHYNRGLALHDLGRYAAAIDALERVVASAPEHAAAWLGRGRALASLNRHNEAMASYGRAGAIRKEDPDVHFSEAMALLALGDYRRGFEKYEARWRRTGMPAQKSRGRPLWLGEYPLAHKTVLLHAEQGFGDTIQFCRYTPLVAARGARVILEVQGPLHELMGTLSGAAQIVVKGEPLPDFDLHCPLLSLPLAFGTELATIPSVAPYLFASPPAVVHWRDRLGPGSRLKIGVAWSGNPKHKNDHNRSIEFGAFLSALTGIDATYVSLQRDVRAGDADLLKSQSDVLHFGEELKTFSDTAALLSNMDLIISVDTGVAHLAGALAKPVWVLLPFLPDWRWLLDRDDSPWYPTARLFRQDETRAWGGVIARVHAALGDHVRAF
jgi:tetratricopeptide (TPR) repeat protein